jgi:hypothetical protein
MKLDGDIPIGPPAPTTGDERSSPLKKEEGTRFAPEEERTRMETALVVGALGSALFLAALDITIVTVAIPTITQEFQSTAGYTWIGSAYMLASAAMAPMWGKISVGCLFFFLSVLHGGWN